jgi:hypothetical protein
MVRRESNFLERTSRWPYAILYVAVVCCRFMSMVICKEPWMTTVV